MFKATKNGKRVTLLPSIHLIPRDHLDQYMPLLEAIDSLVAVEGPDSICLEADFNTAMAVSDHTSKIPVHGTSIGAILASGNTDGLANGPDVSVLIGIKNVRGIEPVEAQVEGIRTVFFNTLDSSSSIGPQPADATMRGVRRMSSLLLEGNLNAFLDITPKRVVDCYGLKGRNLEWIMQFNKWEKEDNLPKVFIGGVLHFIGEFGIIEQLKGNGWDVVETDTLH